MKILMLGPSNSKIYKHLFAFGDHVICCQEKLDIEEVISANYDFILSYGYRYILPKEIVHFYKNKIINLHISYLPWNRGADPNFWSFMDDTPKGVSIHFIDEGIDTGDVIFQERVNFGNIEKHTFDTTYQLLKETIENLFIAKWADIKKGIYNKKKQLGLGSYHKVKDKEPYLHILSEGWSTKLSTLKKQKLKGSESKVENIYVEGLKIGAQQSPFIIAEMSGNHNQSLERALSIVEAAAQSGVHALKIQTYKADTMTLDVDNQDFHISDPESLWKGNSLYSLYQEAYTPWEWHKPIFERARELGMIAFSTPFDETAVDFLEELEVPLYKIASFENNDIPLIKKVASTGKPMIISTGMATVAELDETIRAAREAGCKDIILLKCTSTYPATADNTNILTIPHMKDLFDVQVGLSDHTMGTGVAVASVALGATVIEKHFTLSRADGGVDSAFSMETQEMKALVEETERAWQALGSVTYGPTEKEKASLKFRRSIYVAEDIKAGEKFTKENIRVIRPGYGLEPKYYEIVLGKEAKKDLERGIPLRLGDF